MKRKTELDKDSAQLHGLHDIPLFSVVKRFICYSGLDKLRD